MRSSLRPLLPRLCAALFRRPPIPMRRLACLTGFAAAIALPGAILIATLPSCLGPATTQPGGPGSGREPLPAGSYPEQPLAVGTKVPEFATAGWLNGPPPQPGPDGPRIIVLDIWADW